MVTNGTFESNTSGWSTTTGTTCNSKNAYPNSQQGAFTGKFCENWSGSNFTGKTYQSVSDIPNGTYKLNICAFAFSVDASKGQYVYAGSNKSYIYSATPTAYTVYAYVDNHSLEYGIQQENDGNSWIGIDNVSLEYCGASDVTTDGFIAIYDATTSHINDGDYANVTGAEKTNLQMAVNATPTATVDGYATATFNIKYADDVFMNAKDSYDGLATARTTGATYTKELWPRASTSKKTNLDNAVNAEAPTTAADAVTKTNAITTAIRQFVESNGLCEGLSNAVDYTSYIKDANCDATTGWTIDTSGTSSGGTIEAKNTAAEKYTMGDGTTSGKYLDGGWSTTAVCNQTASQTVTLPAGTYQIQITARSNCSTYTLQIGDNSPINLPKDANTGGTFGNGWSDVWGTFTSDGTPLTITIHGEASGYQTWMSFDRIRLIRTDATIATSDDYEALNSAISVAEGRLGFEEGECAPYNNSGIFPLLATAKRFDQDKSNAQDDVQNATTALTGFSWTENAEELNAVYNGDFSLTENNNAPAGWRSTKDGAFSGETMPRVFKTNENLNEFNETKSAFFIRFDGYNSDRGTLYYYGDADDAHIMPLKAETYYYVKADIKGWGSTGKKQRLNVTGPVGFSGTFQEITLSNNADADDDAPQQFFIIFKTTTAGNYSIYFQTPGDDSQQHNAVVSNIELFKAATATMTVKANKWGTFIAPFAVTIPDGVNAYTVTGVSGTSIVKSDPLVTTIPANTPVILENTTESLISQNFNGKDISSEDSYTVGLLTGVYTAETIAASDGDNTRYVLQTQEDVQAFYKVTSDFTASPNRCYLTVPVASGVKAFYLDGDETAVSSVKADELQGATIYNLAGQRVNKAQKGVYIINGKKVAVK